MRPHSYTWRFSGQTIQQYYIFTPETFPSSIVPKALLLSQFDTQEILQKEP